MILTQRCRLLRGFALPRIPPSRPCICSTLSPAPGVLHQSSCSVLWEELKAQQLNQDSPFTSRRAAIPTVHRHSLLFPITEAWCYQTWEVWGILSRQVHTAQCHGASFLCGQKWNCPELGLSLSWPHLDLSFYWLITIPWPIKCPLFFFFALQIINTT